MQKSDSFSRSRRRLESFFHTTWGYLALVYLTLLILLLP